jgi:Na+-driven multidrug efflux pump
MRGSTRVIVNTCAQYARTVFSALVLLYTSRIVLEQLGVYDYGLYSLVGGVIAMFAFIRGNLARTTQRYLSFYQGRGDLNQLQKIFNNSVCTQLIISIFICSVLVIFTDPIFTHLVNLPEDRIETAKIVYWVMLAGLFVGMQSTPYYAVLISRENIVFSSTIDIIFSTLSVPLVFLLTIIPSDKVIWYTVIKFGETLLSFLIYYIYCKKKYPESHHFSFKSFDLSLCKNMLSFMGWTVYGTVCILGRNQGLAILLNNFYTVAINAAYGIGNQVCGQLGFLSNSLTNAINPQIIKAEGRGDRQGMIRLAEISCKFSFILLSIVSIPAIFNIETILGIWLKEVPEHTAFFVVCFLIANQIDLITLNLNTANQAVGNIKVYTIVVQTIKILTVPAIYVALKLGYGLYIVMTIYLAFETICAAIRPIFMHINYGLSYKSFFRNVLLTLPLPITVNCITCYLLSFYLHGFMFLYAMIVSLVVTTATTYLFGLKDDEKIIINGVISRMFNFKKTNKIK